jgi:hypothetical protein
MRVEKSPEPQRPIMEQRVAQKETVFLTTGEAASLLRIAVSTLSRWRVAGDGPTFLKFGRRVLYAHDDLIAGAKQQSHASTSASSQKLNAPLTKHVTSPASACAARSARHPR